MQEIVGLDRLLKPASNLHPLQVLCTVGACTAGVPCMPQHPSRQPISPPPVSNSFAVSLQISGGKPVEPVHGGPRRDPGAVGMTGLYTDVPLAAARCSLGQKGRSSTDNLVRYAVVITCQVGVLVGSAIVQLLTLPELLVLDNVSTRSSTYYLLCTSACIVRI
ncbi:hypothetical protein BU24DRAFT_288931 [Aaosphaeria arxii CBS 175.79]|uniref:Uncharacterized protein n=1 Tax=Aaosphaeria arxii CBS 175.79 TaxID=1450172 RepID=A0A6A5XHI2_9PLEO|nr:uncharacterized protein BU24DRAFT_288931 [Aaosphaeria arxii CBS 175.79]KAF2011774.1 hypothetical protein BU24DRAFT_288931 [Aaosphaeria arxii CBS 175.79]